MNIYINFGGNDGLKRAHGAAFFRKVDRIGYGTFPDEYRSEELRGDVYKKVLKSLYLEYEYRFA